MEVGPHANDTHRCHVFSRHELTTIPKLEPPFDTKQLSIAIYGMRPSVILPETDPDNPENPVIDSACHKLMTEHFDPLKLKDSSREAVLNTQISLDLLYNS